MITIYLIGVFLTLIFMRLVKDKRCILVLEKNILKFQKNKQNYLFNYLLLYMFCFGLFYAFSNYYKRI